MNPPSEPGGDPVGGQLGLAGVGSWIFVGSLFPSIIFFTAAIIFSFVFFMSPHNCSYWVNGFLLGGIGLAHAFVLIHGYLLLGPPLKSLSSIVAILLIYTAVLFLFNIFGSWTLLGGHQGPFCENSNVWWIAILLNIIFYLYVIAVILICFLLLCVDCPGCGCLRVDSYGKRTGPSQDDLPLEPQRQPLPTQNLPSYPRHPDVTQPEQYEWITSNQSQPQPSIPSSTLSHLQRPPTQLLEEQGDSEPEANGIVAEKKGQGYGGNVAESGREDEEEIISFNVRRASTHGATRNSLSSKMLTTSGGTTASDDIGSLNEGTRIRRPAPTNAGAVS